MKITRPSPLFLIAFVSLLASMSSQFFNPIIAVYARDYLNATVAEIGLIVSAFFIVSIVCKPFIGLYGQGVRVLYVFWFGLALLTFPTLGMALVNSTLLFGVFRVFQGIGNSMVWAPGMTLVGLISPRESLTRNLSNYAFAISIGMSLGPALGSIGVAAFGARNALLTSSAIMFAGFLLGTILIRQKGSFSGRLSLQNETNASITEMPKIFSRASFDVPFMAYFSMAFIYGIIVAYGTLYFKDTFNVLDQDVAILFFGYNLVVMFARFSLGRLVQRTSKRNILFFSLANFIAALTIINISSNFPLFVGAFCLMGLSHGLIYPTGILIIAETTELRKLAFTNTIYLMGWDIGNALGPLVTAPLTADYGTKIALTIALLNTVAIFITLLAFGRRLKDTKKAIE